MDGLRGYYQVAGADDTIIAVGGEQRDHIDVTEQGVLGDRAYALIDTDTGSVVCAKSDASTARHMASRGRTHGERLSG